MIKKTILFYFFMCLVRVLISQGIEIPNIDLSLLITHSSETPSGSIHLRALFDVTYSDYLNNLDIVSIRNGQQFHSGFNSNNTSEMKAVTAFPDMQVFSLGLRYETDFFSFLSPVQVPSGLVSQEIYYIRSGLNDVGEIDQVLDLKDQYFLLEQDHENLYNCPKSLWIALENVSGSYPNSVSFVNYYIYGVILINPEQLQNIDLNDIDFENFNFEQFGDLTAFVMVRASIPVLLSSGLYKVPLSTFTNPENINLSDFTPISSIANEVNQGKLMLGLDFSVLAENEDFGDWPNISSSILSVPFIIKLENILNPSFSYDYGSPVLLYCNPYRISNQPNSIPDISYNYISPNLIEVNYSDIDSHYPVIAEYRSDNLTVDAYSLDYDFTQNATFIISSATSLNQQASIVFSDDSLNFRILEFNPSNLNDNVLDLETGLRVYPNPYHSSRGDLNVSFNKALMREIQLTIYNIRGQKVFHHNYNNENEIKLKSGSINNLSSGIYFLKISHENKFITKKLMILKE